MSNRMYPIWYILGVPDLSRWCHLVTRKGAPIPHSSNPHTKCINSKACRTCFSRTLWPHLHRGYRHLFPGPGESFSPSHTRGGFTNTSQIPSLLCFHSFKPHADGFHRGLFDALKIPSPILLPIITSVPGSLLKTSLPQKIPTMKGTGIMLQGTGVAECWVKLG